LSPKIIEELCMWGVASGDTPILLKRFVLFHEKRDKQYCREWISPFRTADVFVFNADIP